MVIGSNNITSSTAIKMKVVRPTDVQLLLQAAICIIGVNAVTLQSPSQSSYLMNKFDFLDQMG